MTTNILPHEAAARNGRGTIPPKQQNTPGEIRYRIRFLRKTYGDCLNLWPTVAQDEYRELARRLRRLESERNR
jgi:hypothetical protein